jgi:hypothetical protein
MQFAGDALTLSLLRQRQILSETSEPIMRPHELFRAFIDPSLQLSRPFLPLDVGLFAFCDVAPTKRVGRPPPL